MNLSTSLRLPEPSVSCRKSKTLKERGIIKGGGLDSAIVICDHDIGQAEVERLRKLFGLQQDVFIGKTGILNDVPLRFYNEPVRHKVDRSHWRPVPDRRSHQGTHSRRSFRSCRQCCLGEEDAFALPEETDSQEISRAARAATHVLDINAILKILPHRYPFLLIDRIIDIVPGKSVSALKNVTINEPFFQGHFPGHPIMPGVLIVEAMAQAGGFLLLNTVENPETKVVYFMGIDGVRFRKPVMPGDQLRFELKMLSFRRGICKMTGETFVGDTLVCEAEMLAAVVDQMSTNIIHPTAIVAAGASLGDDIEIGAHAIIEDNVVHRRRLPNRRQCSHRRRSATRQECQSASRRRARDNSAGSEIWRRSHSLLRVGDNTIIREYATVNRGTKHRGETTIGSDCLLMAYSHVAHDCIIGDHVILVNSVNLAGHIEIGDYAILGGLVPVHQFVKIGRHVMIGGGFRVPMDICPYRYVWWLSAEGNGTEYDRTQTARVSARKHSTALDKAFRHSFSLQA